MKEHMAHVYTEEEAYARLTALCARGELCLYDVERKMTRWGMEGEAVEHVSARLVEERYVDEARFARAFVRDKFRYNRWGKMRIVRELQLRRIDRSTIDEALEEMDDKDVLHILRDLVAKKRPSVKGRNEYEIRGKLTRFALGRGFAMDDVLKVVGSLDDCVDDDFDDCSCE